MLSAKSTDTVVSTVGSLSSRGILVDMTISYWVARLQDKKASRDAEAASEAREGSGKYHKHLINPDAATYVAVKEAVREVRGWHYMNTLPWSNAARVLPTSNFMTYTDGLRDLRLKFDNAVDDLMDDYACLISDARLSLGKMFSELDYPSRDDLRGKFGIVVDISPIPDSDDFRVHLADDQVSAIKSQIEDGVRRSTDKAMRDVWVRLHDRVSNMVVSLSKADPKFRDSLVDNIHALCDLLPRLNLTNDPRLTEIGAQVMRQLGSYDGESLRTDSALRAKVAKDAAALADKMSGMFGGAK